MKDFITWMPKKIKINNLNHKPPYVSEGDIWWVSIGENIGSEIDEKSDLFSRPVIIYKKLAHGFYLVIPTSTKNKSGTWYVSYKHKGIDNVACLHQVRTIDYRRVLSKLGTLDDSDFVRIQNGFNSLYR